MTKKRKSRFPVTKPHYHRNENGILVKCYHDARNLLKERGFWIGVTVSYPIEHALWEHVLIPAFHATVAYIGGLL